jgi:SAM-dependent methyltransferase
MTSSEFVQRYIDQIKPGGEVLDLACGSGRHSRLLLEQGFSVTAVDRDISGVRDLTRHGHCRIIAQDLEDGSPWFDGRPFDGIVVTNYLYRPMLFRLPAMLADDGVLIYETFMVGNEQYGRPANPAFLLNDSELETTFASAMTVLAFEQGYTDEPAPAVVQRFCGRLRAA